MKILHTADWHTRDRDIDECEKCLGFVVKSAKTEAVDLIVIAGDIFDSQEIKLDSKAARLTIATVSELSNAAPVAIVTGTPSHDGKAPEILRYCRSMKHDVFVAIYPQQVYLQEGLIYDRPAGEGDFQEPDLILTFVPQPTKQFYQTSLGIVAADQEMGAAMSTLFASFGARAAEYHAPHILIYHGAVSGCRWANGQIRTGMDIEVSLDEMELGNFDLGCLGPIHSAQKLGNKYFYPGPLYATKIDECEAKGFYIHDLTGGAIASIFYETPATRTIRLVADLALGDMIDRDREALTCQDGDMAGAKVRIELTVWQDEIGLLDKLRIAEHYKSLGALEVDIRITALPRENVRAEAVLNAITLRQEIEEMAKLRGEEVSADISAKADLLENGGVEITHGRG